MNPAEVVQVSWLFAFLAGVISFLSPCVLPLIPGYVSMVSKMSFEELTDGSMEGKVTKIFFPSLLFVLGFSFVFVSLGAGASFIGNFIQENKLLLLRISGVMIILFGLFSMDILKIPQLYRERRITLPEGNLGLISTFLLGIAFGFGWTPCVGPILASILLYASTAEGTGKGAALLFVYSIGLGLPFLLTGLALSKALTAFGWIKRHYNLYKIIVGGTLIAVGLLMLTNNLFYLNIYGQRALDFIGLDFWKTF
ncbi:MAG: sulfite exporter TauE/SafE family protein [Candidatus Dadabacteria bacterium]|nr:sulfite exporter TauE/SafE family protein [Candidatus Dadabacteria bacterium]